MAECQRKQLSEVQQAGRKSELEFIQASFTQKRIKEINTTDTLVVLGLILYDAAKLAGIKDGIQQDVKGDIKDLIFNRFGSLSLEEIAYAFKLERQLAYPVKTEHYQFFSTEYVATILGKYEEWKREKRKVHNIDPEKKALPQKEISDNEKVLSFLVYLMNDFEYYKAHKVLQLGAFRHYLPLFYLGLLPEHTEEFKAQITLRAKEALRREMQAMTDIRERRTIKQIIEGQMDDAGRIKGIGREIILCDFFDSIIAEGKDLSQMIDDKIHGKSDAEILQMIRYNNT